MVQNLGANLRAVDNAHVRQRVSLQAFGVDGRGGGDDGGGLLDGEHVSEGAAVPAEVAGAELVGGDVVHHQEVALLVQAPHHLLPVALGVAGDGRDHRRRAEGLQPPADLHAGAVYDEDAGAVAVPHLRPAAGDLHGLHGVGVLPGVVVGNVELGPVGRVGAQVGAGVCWDALGHRKHRHQAIRQAGQHHVGVLQERVGRLSLWILYLLPAQKLSIPEALAASHKPMSTRVTYPKSLGDNSNIKRSHYMEAAAEPHSSHPVLPLSLLAREDRRAWQPAPKVNKFKLEHVQRQPSRSQESSCRNPAHIQRGVKHSEAIAIRLGRRGMEEMQEEMEREGDNPTRAWSDCI